MNYSTLKTVATTFNVIGVIHIATTIFATFIVTSNTYYPQAKLLVLAAGILCTFLSVLWFAAAQFLKLLINAAMQIENIDNNVYLLASKAEEVNN